MIDPSWIPTPLPRVARPGPVEIGPLETARWRFRTSLATGLWLGAVVGSLRPEDLEAGRAAGIEVRRRLGRVRGIFVPLAQLLATWQARFPTTFVDELLRLQHQSLGFEPALARSAIERELRGPIESWFGSFEEHPFAAGAYAQVHRATRRDDGRSVVVKVLRPDIEALLDADLRAFGRMIRLVSLVRSVAHLRLGELLGELRRIAQDVTDYQREACGFRELRRTASDPWLGSLRVHEDLSTRRVLVIDRVEAPVLSEVLELMETEPDRARGWLEENGVSPRRLARRIYQTQLRQVLEESIFHAQPGPANIQVLRGDRFALLATGQMGRLDQAFQRKFTRFLRSLLSREYKDSVDRFVRFFDPLPPIDLYRLRSDLQRVFRDWDSRTLIRDLPYGVRSLSSLWAEVGRISNEYRIPSEWYLFRLDQGFLSVDLSMSRLHPRVDYHRELARYFRTSWRRAVPKALGSPGPLAAIGPRAIDRQLEDAGEDFANIVSRNSLDFQSTTGKITAVCAILFRQGRVLCLAAAAITFLAFLDRAVVPIRPDVRWSRLGAVLAGLPRLTAWDWALLSTLSLLGWRTAGQASERLVRKESRYRSLTD